MIKIQKLDIDDASSYQMLRLKALKENETYFSSSYEEEKDRDLLTIGKRFTQANAHTYGAFINELLVGIITLVYESRIKTKHTADIYGMYVDSNYRKQGIGKSLLNHVLSEANKRGLIEKVRLSVTDINKQAISLYESIGFKMYALEENSMKINGKYYHTCFMEYYV
jgi:ribosomal protein S18 acetylase RimI-like enzyme